jgi:hypothetical protein
MKVADYNTITETYKSILEDELIATIEYYKMDPGQVIF